MHHPLILLISGILLLLAQSCCNCSNDEQTFSEAEKEWIPKSKTGDSVFFINCNGQTKTFYNRVNEEFISEKKSAGPTFCNCLEQNTRYYTFQFTGELIPNALVSDGLTINLQKKTAYLGKHLPGVVYTLHSPILIRNLIRSLLTINCIPTFL
jgi:hypothetical protein